MSTQLCENGKSCILALLCSYALLTCLTARFLGFILKLRHRWKILSAPAGRATTMLSKLTRNLLL